MKMQKTECYETSVHKIQTSGNYPKERLQNSEYGENFKSGIEKNLLRFVKTYKYTNLIISSEKARPHSFQNYLNARQLLLLNDEFMFCLAESVTVEM